MKELSFIYFGLGIGMLSPLENKVYAIIPIFLGGIIYFVSDYLELKKAVGK